MGGEISGSGIRAGRTERSLSRISMSAAGELSLSERMNWSPMGRGLAYRWSHSCSHLITAVM